VRGVRPWSPALRNFHRKATSGFYTCLLSRPFRQTFIRELRPNPLSMTSESTIILQKRSAHQLLK
jgi:hypothetical protein